MRTAEESGLHKDLNLIVLIFCVQTTFFQIDSDIYQQEEGLAMGSTLFPLMVNIYMKYLEEMALRNGTTVC